MGGPGSGRKAGSGSRKSINPKRQKSVTRTSIGLNKSAITNPRFGGINFKNSGKISGKFVARKPSNLSRPRTAR